jgi:hypothetical protein
MSYEKRCRLSLVLMVFGLFMIGPRPARAQCNSDYRLNWLLTRNCVLPPGIPQQFLDQRLECGNYGDFFMTLDPRSSSLFMWVSDACPIAAQGWECVPTFALPVGGAGADPGAWVPCAGGSCSSPGGQPGSPWMAVIDWATPHGWSVAETAREAAGPGVGVELLPLDHPNSRLPLLGNLPVGDLHLLIQLCSLAERLQQGALPPLVVNLSVGRAIPPPIPQMDAPQIATQVSGVINRLRTDYGTVFVSADGHHRSTSFPASIPGVLSAGMVDLTHLRQGAFRKAWQTGPATRAVFPGNGLTLFSADESSCWPAPPGSSYSAAIASGWIAGYRARGGAWSQDWITSRWGLALDAAGRAHLTRDDAAVPGTDLDAPSALINRVIASPACNALRPAVALTLTVTGPTASDPIGTRPSQPEAIALIGPNPNNVPCVPCEIPMMPHGGAPPQTFDVTIQLDATRALPTSQQVLDIFLVVEGVYYALNSDDKASVLSSLGQGLSTVLTLRSLPAAAVGGEVSLLFILKGQGREFWTSTPINALP